MILASDIGGTKTALGIYSHEAGVGSPMAQETFSSGNYGSLEATAWSVPSLGKEDICTLNNGFKSNSNRRGVFGRRNSTSHSASA